MCALCDASQVHGIHRRGSPRIGSRNGQGGLLEKLMTKSRAEVLQDVVHQSSEDKICKDLSGRGNTVHLVELEVKVI